MRILIISQYFWPEGFRVNEIAEGLVERGHDVTVLTGLPNYPQGELAAGYSWLGPCTEDYHGAKIIRAPLVTRGRGRGIRLALNFLSYAISACIIGLLRCRGRVDAIFVFQPSPVTVGVPARLLGAIKRAPILFWVLDLWPESLSATGAVHSPIVLRLVARLVRWIYHGCAKVLVQSEAFFQPVIEMGVSPEDVLYFPNSAETSYAPLPMPTPWNGPQLPDGFRVMFAGNLGKAQSLRTMLEAAEHLRTSPHIHWIILGDGRQMNWLKHEIDKRGLAQQMQVMGRHPVEEMPAWYAQADVMLATLRKDPIFALTVPARIQSYMACAKPIIAAIDGEASRLVETAKAGTGISAEDSTALAKAVLEMSRMPPDERAKLGQNGHAYFQRHFKRNVLLDRLEGWLLQTVGDRP